MKTFLYNVLKFSVFSISVIVILYFLILGLYLYKLNTIKLNDNINTLILGDSYTQCALNDSLFDNSVNYSHNAEHYLLTFNVLKLIIKNNPQVRNLILGFSYHNVSGYQDRYILGKKDMPDEFSQFFLSKYFSMLDNDSKLFLVRNNLPGIIKSFKDIALDMIGSFTGNYSKYQDYPFVGRYYPGKKRALNDSLINRSIKWVYYSDSTGAELEKLSILQSEYLKDIVSFCKEKNIRLVLLNTPVHRDYLGKVPEKFISGYYSLLKELEESNQVTLFDYPDHKFPDEFFGDGEHLNLLGASVFTQEIMNRLENN